MGAYLRHGGLCLRLRKLARDIDCSATDCDMDDDGIDDVLVGADRAWVDLPGSPDLLGCDGCAQRSYDTAECCPIAGASTGCMALPACLPGTRDVRPSLISGAYGRSGRPVGIPIYGDGGSSADHACPKGNGHSIVRLGCAVVEPPLQEHETSCALGTYPCYDASTHEVHLSPSVKSVVVRVMVACGNCTTDCGATVGNPPPSGGGAVLAVSLID